VTQVDMVHVVVVESDTSDIIEELRFNYEDVI